MSNSDDIPEPTSDQCNEHAEVFRRDGMVGYAIWYPQMGGYSGKAVAVMCEQWTENDAGGRTGGCIDVFVWHDGEFPFDGESGRDPVRIHHCDPEQFIEFGQTLQRLNTAGRAEVQ